MSLQTLNSLRTQHGMPPLKSWKESRAKLQAQIDRLTPPAAADILAPPYKVTILPPSDPNLIREAKRRARVETLANKLLDARDAEERAAATADIVAETKPVVVKAPVKAKVERRKEVPAGSITLADIAREMGISPKIARAKMRKHKVDFETDKYCYPSARKPDIIKILRHK